jgi:internalin A
VQNLPHIGDDVPAKWIQIRKELEVLAQSRPCISLDDYYEVYGHHLELDREKALRLSEYLHDLGVFLHFQQPRELRRTVFLQNIWVTEAVFRILDDELIKSRAGRFLLSDCDRLWADKGFTEKEVELRALMVRFELAYKLPDTQEDTWLVPQHLSPSKPTDIADWLNPEDLVLTYRYEFLPRGLVSRLIVRMHRFVKRPDLCWSLGALFEHGETQLLVETTMRGNEIALRSRGIEQKELMSVIASDLDTLNNSFQGLKDKVSKWVPCTCQTCKQLKEPAMFEQKELVERNRRGKRTIECPKPPEYKEVNVIELLEGIHIQKLPTWAREIGPINDKFAIAVSFPGEHRSLVLEIVEHLAESLGQNRVFYDDWYEAQLLGRGGDLKVQECYNRAELVVPFFSKYYTKPWCTMEWETIRGILLKRNKDDAVIPVHIDETEIPGWPAVGIGIKIKGRTPEKIADLILSAYWHRH